MKKITSLAILMILFSLSVFAAGVTINPSNPNTNDNLVCSYIGQGSQLLTFTWFVGDSTQAYSHLSTVPASATEPGQKWTCIVKIPPTRFTGEINLGSATVTIIEIPQVQILLNVSTIPTSGTLPLNVSFTSAASKGTAPYSYSWDFENDGSNDSTSQNPTHVYSIAGTYTAKLSVMDSAGKTKQSTATITVSNPPAILLNITANPTFGTLPLNVSFSSIVSGGLAPYSYKWDFQNDGSTDSTSQSSSYIYSIAGYYTARLNVTDSLGKTKQSITIINVSNPPVLSATIVATPNSGATPLNVAFNSTVSGGLAPYRYSWDYTNDGSTDSTLKNPSYAYNSNGVYTVKLGVNDSLGTYVTDSETIKVCNSPSITNLMILSKIGFVNQTTFTLQSVVSGSCTPFSLMWYYGDGTSEGPIPQTTVVNHVFLKNKTFKITAVATDNIGLQTNKSVYVNVTKQMSSIFTAIPSSGPTPLNVSFTSSTTGGWAPFAYKWDFQNDGSIDSTSRSPSYVYSVSGNYTIRLNITDALGFSSQSTKSIFTCKLPKLNLTYDTNGTESLTQLNFTAVTNSGCALSWLWIFGDGTTNSTSSLSVSHTYMNDGSYQVNVTIVNVLGARASKQVTVNVANLDNLVANFTVSKTNVNESGVIVFTDTSSSYSPITKRLWIFGDFTSSNLTNPTHTYLVNGTFMVKLNVTNADGVTRTATPKIITVKDLIPRSDFILWTYFDNVTNSYYAPLNWPIMFVDTSYSYPDPIVETRWNYWDGATINYYTNHTNVTRIFSIASDKSVWMSPKDSDSWDGVGISKAVIVRNANLYGTITNASNGVPIKSANISFYPDTTCPLNDTTLHESGNATICNMNPKPIPDAVTNEKGNYSAYLPNGTYTMVVQHSKQVEKNVKINNSKQKIDSEVKEGQIDKNVNFEGHIQLAANYRNGNKYVVGDPLQFVMFGNNQGNSDVIVSFLIEHHDTGNVGPWVLNGSFKDTTKVLTVPAHSVRTTKYFNITVPNVTVGKYDIHVMYNNSGVMEKWHKIGNFFVTDRETEAAAAPDPVIKYKLENWELVDTTSTANYVNQSANLSFKVKVPALTNTICAITGECYTILTIQVEEDCKYSSAGDEVLIVAPGANITVNNTKAYGKLKINVSNAYRRGCYVNAGFRYNTSRIHQVNVTLKDATSGKTGAIRTANVSMWATEQQARDIYYDITEIDLGNLTRLSGKGINFTGYYRGDHCGGTGGFCGDSTNDTLIWGTSPIGGNVTIDIMATSMGFEYRSSEDGYDYEPSYCDIPATEKPGATDCERDYLNNRWHIPNPEYILVINPMIKDDVARVSTSFAKYIVINWSRSP